MNKNSIKQKSKAGCWPGFIWWPYTSFSQSIWISQLGLGLYLKLSFIEKNSGLFYGYLRTKAFISGDLCVLHNVKLWNISFPWWVAPKKKKCKPWWQPLANTSLISQFQENISSFNFLANTLKNELPIEFNLESFRFGNCNHNHHTMFNH